MLMELFKRADVWRGSIKKNTNLLWLTSDVILNVLLTGTGAFQPHGCWPRRAKSHPLCDSFFGVKDRYDIGYTLGTHA